MFFLSRFLFVVLAFNLTACTNTFLHQTKVHLYRKYLSDPQTKDLSQELVDSGFDVVPNQLNFPTNIDTNSIIYSALLKDPHELNQLMAVLERKNIHIAQTIPMSSGNHKYTKNSMALFVLPEKQKLVTKRDLSQKYQSEQCDKTFNLILREDGSFSIYGDALKRDNYEFSEGTWKYTSFPYLELTVPYKTRTWAWYMIASKRSIEDQLGETNLIELKASAHHPLIADCVMTYGIRG